MAGIFIWAGNEERVVGVFAGDWSPFSHQVGLRITPSMLPLGVCTSSGTIGPSFSYGVADAVVVLAPDVALAECSGPRLPLISYKASRICPERCGLLRLFRRHWRFGCQGRSAGCLGQIELVNIAK
jgi:hypothetical protein